MKQITLHIAPMLDVSYHEFRYFIRLLTLKATLWTEMVVAETVLHASDVDHRLYVDHRIEHPIICQLGGNHPEWAAQAVQIVEQQYGYDGVDLNCGCPSNKVAVKHQFGAALLKNPNMAVENIKRMSQAVCNIPVSVKTRIGVDHHDDLTFLMDFVSRLTPYCQSFVLHARKVYTKGLSPAQNRNIPPLNYPRVYQLCEAFPDCDFVINGGIDSLRSAKAICLGSEVLGLDPSSPCDTNEAVAPPRRAPSNLKGCMVGRAAMDNPAMLWDTDRYIYGETTNPCHNRRQVLTKYAEYLECLYPRRCCDDDPVVTTKFPAPKVERVRKFCSVCENVYGQDILQDETNLNRSSSEPVHECRQCEAGDVTIKMSGHILFRALKPVLGIFFKLQGAKKFRVLCHELCGDPTIRNCGPGYALRRAMNAMPAELLDQDFVPTEETL